MIILLTEYSSGRSQTPVKKLKKKNKHLRKNKLAPSDDEHELSDITQSPKKEPLPWDKQQQPESQLEIVDALDDDITAGLCLLNSLPHNPDF